MQKFDYVIIDCFNGKKSRERDVIEFRVIRSVSTNASVQLMFETKRKGTINKSEMAFRP